MKYYGGDIILTEWQKKMILEGEDEIEIDNLVSREFDGVQNVNRRAVALRDAYHWPNGIVPYVIDKSLSKCNVIDEKGLLLLSKLLNIVQVFCMKVSVSGPSSAAKKRKKINATS